MNIRLRANSRLVVPAVAAALLFAGTIANGAPTDPPAAPSSPGRTVAPRDTEATTDRAITTEVRSRLSATRGLEPANIRVSTTDGVVRLEGTVRDDAQRARVMETARGVRGVTAVSDELKARTD
ncbi:BON domain-containing protein [Cupriavidus pinatubonensis]|uniref:BON domain-containing protein n=1 Tax=Cupriavidus pinatubonensis TaxID=248026 RepID=UPI001C73B970|nr:BON domain-containing protein [Cupriavidus pinatubonensis]QYY28695.1 BON domain-containing protein [Cupriavidus pinatubonensis]